MPDLKLARLPDRTPVKLTIQLAPDLSKDLMHYAELYRATYGEAVGLADLVPAILGSFLASDREFMKARKDART